MLVVAYIIATAVPLIALYLIYQLDLYATGSYKQVILCFIWGGLSVGIAAFLANWIIFDLQLINRTSFSQFAAPILEELLKALILIYLVRRADFTYFVDGAIYGFAVGIGFAILENYLYLSNQSTVTLNLAIGRVLSTNLMHAAATSIVGIVLGKARFSRFTGRLLALFLGFMLAVLVHAGFNNLVTRINGRFLLLYAILSGFSGLGIIIYAIRRGLAEEKVWIEETLGMADRVTASEAAIVQQLNDVYTILTPLACQFGAAKAEKIEDFLLLQIIFDDHHGRELLLNEYGPGKVIGELALLTQQPRAATTPTTLLKLSRPTFLHTVQIYEQTNQTSIHDLTQHLRQHYTIETLKRIDWFAHLPPEALSDIVQELKKQQYNEGNVLFEQGDSGDALYILTKGWVNAFVTNEKGEKLPVNQLGPNNIFGEMALIDGKSRSAGIIALSPIEVLILSRDQFLDIIHQSPLVAQETLRRLSQKLRFATTYLEIAINWSQRIAAGDYSMVLDQIESNQNNIVGDQQDKFRVDALLSAFFHMVEGVQQREEALRQEVKALKLSIEINQEKRREQYQAVTNNPFFASLKAQAKQRWANRGEESTADE